MLLTIHNLPLRTQYNDVEDLIRTKCGLEDLILDKLQNEGSGMRVTIGLADDEDAAILVRKINGIYYGGQQLYVEDKRNKKEAEQPYRRSNQEQPQYMVKEPPAQQGYDFNTQMMKSMHQPLSNYAMYQPQPSDQTGVQNTFTAYGVQQMQPQQFLSQYTGVVSEINQQPYVPLVQQNLGNTGLHNKRPLSPDRQRSMEGVRSGRDDRRHDSSPSAHASWAYRRDEPPELPNYQDSPSGRNERLHFSSGFRQPKDVYQPGQRQYNDDSYGFNASDSHGGHFSNMRDTHGGQSAYSRDIRGGHSSTTRKMRGGHSSVSQNMRGGHTTKSRDMSGNYSSNSNGMRGGHSSMSYDMRSDHSVSFRDMRGDQTDSYRNTRGDQSDNFRDMRGDHSDNFRDRRGDHSDNFRDMRGDHSDKFRDRRGGNTDHARYSRGELTPNSRELRGGHSPDVRDSRPQNAKKRRWEESTTQFKRGFERPAQNNWRDQPNTQWNSRQLQREEPQPKKFMPQSTQKNKGKKKGGTFSKPAAKDVKNVDWKALKISHVKGVGKLLYIIATHLKIVPEFEGPNLVKTELRKILTSRVNDELTGMEVLTPHEITARYRQRYPASDDFDVYNTILQKLADTDPEKTEQGPGCATKSKKKALKNQVLPLSPGKIPSYPQGNKKVHAQIKQQQKKDMATLESCQVNPTYQKAMDEEIDAIGALLEKELENQKEILQTFPKKEQEKCIALCKKLVTFHISRRITNRGPKLVRIFGHPKPPKRTELEAFLSKYSCLSLRKSAKSPFFTASFDLYDTVDELCSMKPVEIGDRNITVTFKPMHVAPQRKKMDHTLEKRIRKMYTLSLIDKSKVNLLDKNWQTMEEEERKAKVDDNVIHTDGKNNTENQITNDENVEPTIQNAVSNKRKISAVDSEDNHDVSHIDVKVTDEVTESENIEVLNNTSNKKSKTEQELNAVEDDWIENGEDWGNIDDEGNITNAGEDDNETEADGNDKNVGDIHVADVDLDDVNEDDLEDY